MIFGKTRHPARATHSRLAAVLASALVSGCAIHAGPLADPSLPGGSARSCARITQAGPATSIEAARASGPLRSAVAAPPVEGFSQSATSIAEVIGALEPLRQMSALELQAGDPASAATELRLFRARQRITDTILRAMLDVSSVLAEVDCENERGDQLKDHLQKLEDRRTRGLGLGSILVGALTAILSGGLSLASPNAAGGDVAAIVGGTLEASVGASVLLGTVSGELRTERNLMREVWEGPVRSSLFPRSVWRFLGRRVGDDPDSPTLREILIAQWRTGDRLGPAQSQEERDRIALLFGPGGDYTIADLNARDAMLDLLESSVASMNQDLQLLLDELMKRSEATLPSSSP